MIKDISTYTPRMRDDTNRINTMLPFISTHIPRMRDDRNTDSEGEQKDISTHAPRMRDDGNYSQISHDY